MIDIRLLREEPDNVRNAVKNKNGDPKLVDAFLELDQKWRAATKELDNLRARQAEFSAKRDAEEGKKNKEWIRAKESELTELEKERQIVWWQIPNIPLPDVPIGKDEGENKVLRTWGEPTKLDFKPKDHVELGEHLGLIDIERASKVSGTRFSYLKGDAVLLEFALIQHAFRVLGDRDVLSKIAERVRSDYPATPFTPVVPPVMIRPDVFEKMARLEPKDERYYLPSDDLYLVGSAEHTLGPLHMDETIREDQLPLRYVGFSTSFRREAGSYGKDTRGILRVHQFDKIEMESFTLPEDSLIEQEFIVAIQEYLMQSLNIPYRVIAICTGDMSSPDVRQIDIEAWMPAQATYRETHTSDLVTDYQSRRLGTRVKRKSGKLEFVHMNDATAFAIGRTLIAIMENYQTADGKIRVPEAMESYVGKKNIG